VVAAAAVDEKEVQGAWYLSMIRELVRSWCSSRALLLLVGLFYWWLGCGGCAISGCCWYQFDKGFIRRKFRVEGIETEGKFACVFMCVCVCVYVCACVYVCVCVCV